MVLFALATASPAAAVDIIEDKPETVEAGWQAGTCTKDAPECTVDTPDQFFTQAAGHPPVGFTQIIVKHTGAFKEPVGHIKTVLVDLPQGMSVNPEATPKCELTTEGKFPVGGCPSNTQVGYSNVEASTGIPPVTLPPVEVPGIAVYNLKPREGEPARFGFTLPLGLGEVFLNAGVKWDGDYHEYFTIHVPEVPGLDVRILRNRLVFDGTIGNGPLPGEEGGAFLTTPSTCFNPNQPAFATIYNTILHADSQEEEAPQNEYDVAAPAPPSAAFIAGSERVESPLPKGKDGQRLMPEGCDKIPFEPTTSQSPGTNQTDSPMGGMVEVTTPFIPSAPIYQSNVRKADVSLPQGMGLNPSAAPGLQACRDDQFNRGSRAPIACPLGSKIGTVAIDTPPLPDGTLTGNVYLGTQQSRDPASGNEYRIFIAAESASRGLSIRLLGNVSANPQTGQLTAQVHEAPQLPFESVRVTLDGGKGPLTSPPTCGPNKTTHAMTAWSGTPDSGPQDKGFTLSSAPGGGPCAKTLGERPFGPSFGTHGSNPKGGAFTQFAINTTRNDGNQELKGVDVTLPPGLTAKLAGVRYCPAAAIAAAANASGSAETANSSCPNQSLIGSAAISAGSGSNPFKTTGKVFLAGPYRGAPLSLAVITPATAGPFDLGAVVVRVALFVDPATAQVHAVSDPIPHVFGGALLDIRSVAVKLDRPKFALNPTNCSPLAVAGSLKGGGANPLDPAAFSSLPVSSPFRVNDCDKLGFKPKLYMRLFGGTRRAKSPKLRAILVAREGDANIGRAAVTLPKALALEQSSLANVCTRVQFAAHKCPKDSIYGYATAETPLLDGPLKGPVYLRSSDNELPDMVAALNGQVDIALAGRIDSAKGRLRTTFDVVPDVPVSKFALTVRGGKKRGLLVNTRSLCARKYKVIARFKGQNGKKANMRPKLRAPCKKHGKKGKGKKKGGKR
ncbi:MAG TPA: hypothetical protein VFS48_00695 [Solirubrobacterales bacterium]|nr:hypothetical protein [Solirubrobacterales bacterium]